MGSDKENNILKVALSERKTDFEKQASEELKQKYAEGVDYVRDQKPSEIAIQVGDKAPDFTLKNAVGEEINLYTELKNGPVILMWYRGGWCPYCNITLNFMQKSLPEFKKLGANLFALTPETPDNSISTSEKNHLEFEVLSDLNNKIAHLYKVVYKLSPEISKSYEDAFGLSKYNGNNDAELPLAATYLINTDGVVKFAFLDEDYTKRAEPNDIIKALKS